MDFFTLNLNKLDMSPIKCVTIKAPVNIAVIKYWGKSNEKLILALNDSISGTLSIDQLSACTTVMVSDKFTSDRFWLNGKEHSIESNKRLIRCLEEIRKLSKSENAKLKMHICSVNNFPTAAGLASSAAGYACLAYSIGQILEVTDVKTLSIISRLGSGSACRSLYGGFVQWLTSNKSEESYAKQIVDEFYWPEMRIIVLVVNDAEKDTPSTTGMQSTVKTSTLFEHRISIVPKRVEEMIKAIQDKNFHKFAEITMKDSNQFHACCADTYPPIRYMNDISWSIVKMVHKLNDFYGTNRLAYTFDAGPNACIYLLKDNVDEFLTLINHLYPNSKNNYKGEQVTFTEIEINGEKHEIENEIDLTKNIDNNYYRGIPFCKKPLKENLLNLFNKDTKYVDQLKGIISTKLGCGPQIQSSNQSLLNDNGLPK